jgi:hypothetical protein
VVIEVAFVISLVFISKLVDAVLPTLITVDRGGAVILFNNPYKFAICAV